MEYSSVYICRISLGVFQIRGVRLDDLKDPVKCSMVAVAQNQLHLLSIIYSFFKKNWFCFNSAIGIKMVQALAVARVDFCNDLHSFASLAIPKWVSSTLSYAPGSFSPQPKRSPEVLAGRHFVIHRA